MKIDKQTLERLFKNTLDDFGIGSEYKVVKEVNMQSLLSVKVDSKGIAVLNYHPKSIRIFINFDELRSAVRHEICHILTLPTHEVPTLMSLGAAGMSAHLAYIDIFREYLAEVEYHKRIPDNKPYLVFKKRIFDPNKMISVAYKDIKKRRPEDGPFILFDAIFRIFYDAIYFHVKGDCSFREWCEMQNRHALYEFFNIVMNDMEFIQLKQIDYLQKMELVSTSFDFAFNIDLDRLMIDNKLSLMGSFDEIEYKNDELLSLWQSRNIQPR